MTLVASLLVADGSRGGAPLPEPVQPTSRAVAPRWMDRLEASLRRAVDAGALLMARSTQPVATEVAGPRLPEPTPPAFRRDLLSVSQFPLPPPAC